VVCGQYSAVLFVLSAAASQTVSSLTSTLPSLYQQPHRRRHTCVRSPTLLLLMINDDTDMLNKCLK
jgi:hypothetical protein